MATRVTTVDVEGLDEAVGELRAWQVEGAPMQLHPGDLGWFRRFGASTTAAALRTWRRDGRIVALGLLDGADLLRLTTAPELRRDEELARRVAEDVTDPARGVLGPGRVSVEAPSGALVRDVLAEAGWSSGELWTPLRRDLTESVPEPGIRVEVIGPDRAAERAAVQRASFDGSSFTEDLWKAMAAGPQYTDARCLLGYDSEGSAVAAVTVWSAGPSRPGLIEPMGVHRDHRGRGHGRAITLAAAAALRDLGSSNALVGTPSSNLGGVATYRSAGFQLRPELPDLTRNA
ncbi:GNAT family N-acetyltransferase [Microlunatus sp. GCM10028923]|uniref:GNAT family N-acetyltransferase n=1 Tax=Microlunatus sp. GCM10028923 TaxID=3273400 RepID=UPI003606D916